MYKKMIISFLSLKKKVFFLEKNLSTGQKPNQLRNISHAKDSDS